MVFLSILIAFAFVGWVLNFIEERKEEKRNAALEIIAREVMGSFDIQAAKLSVLNKAEVLAPKKFRCERCTGMLVKREGRNGGFMGCSHYPMCSYTTNETYG